MSKDMGFFVYPGMSGEYRRCTPGYMHGEISALSLAPPLSPFPPPPPKKRTNNSRPPEYNSSGRLSLIKRSLTPPAAPQKALEKEDTGNAYAFFQGSSTGRAAL